MAATKRKTKKPASLAAGRSKHLSTHKPGSSSSLSAKATASIIRRHHQLQKAHAQAVRAGEHARAAAIQRDIDAAGGIETYQVASITGQSSERGGDSSRVLVDWLEELQPALKKKGAAHKEKKEEEGKAEESRLRLLEVGALSTTNACSKRRYFAVERIDLHSQGAGITQQDFMQRPLPVSDSQRFDVLSLSLVLNYVPDAVGRGEMLRRTCAFLSPNTPAVGSERSERSEHSEQDEQSEQNKQNKQDEQSEHSADDQPPPFPALFLVLPAPCITNSRYLDRARLGAIMGSLGYVPLREKLTAKLVYQLWRYDGPAIGVKRKQQQFPKVEVHAGGKRNNFCVVLE
ncbi:uncharacterized protein K452DRAFT_297261 [Aplosporella prunicola CBS 121167]|uniref:25S rRNA adenine-N(1) methyltransferase n=1 Tax=Aplosporella prunicola CBS 121167 TaxID=1176127 RepID=A0A6A6BJG4_9PEZI|nr:uncharacterized protein K452DRAFT_297261 [Aplosporella prunicola CBS 121167]KAF2142711.1 hypothetical protein K452DRAFT_297261 [Aplosporella prunicola CBS 121167]